MQSKNTYYVCLGKKPIAWDLYDAEQKINVHTDYFRKAFIAMEQALKTEGWTIYMTWNTSWLPSYGPKVIAVLLGDELAQMPLYRSKVAMIFKCYGVGPPLGCKPHKDWTYQNVLTLLQHGYAKAKYIQSLVKEKRSRRKKTSTTKTQIYPIPLGYANQVEVPFIPFHKRTIDVSFAGSVVHRKYKWWSIQKWFKTPKSYSRSKMISALQKFADKHTSLNVNLKVTPSFKAIRSEDPVSYSDRVMSTRISLVPRGASYETYRFFESIRFGCLVVAEYLPDFWFYEGAPVIHIKDWKNLEKELMTLVESPSKAELMHQQVLDWWESKCSEKALGDYMASKINEASGVTQKTTTQPIQGVERNIH